jgi:hypothetical protein
VCGIGGAQPCACSTVRLDAEVLAELRVRYAGCLCLNCLVSLSGVEEPAAGDDGAPLVSGR